MHDHVADLLEMTVVLVVVGTRKEEVNPDHLKPSFPSQRDSKNALGHSNHCKDLSRESKYMRLVGAIDERVAQERIALQG